MLPLIVPINTCLPMSPILLHRNKKRCLKKLNLATRNKFTTYSVCSEISFTQGRRKIMYTMSVRL